MLSFTVSLVRDHSLEMRSFNFQIKWPRLYPSVPRVYDQSS